MNFEVNRKEKIWYDSRRCQRQGIAHPYNLHDMKFTPAIT